ncbi:hypothetical protein PENSPDRAFT_513311 [Peniophora sp. CONT]|nr:hypothetical protein PENSPDRAFT_513311 [Peniophora sp. CONT]
MELCVRQWQHMKTTEYTREQVTTILLVNARSSATLLSSPAMLFHPAISRFPHTRSPALGDRRRSPSNDDSAAAALRELWVAALDDYRRTVDIDLRGHILLGELETCETSDQMFGVLCAASTYLKNGTSSQFAEAMKHVVGGLSEFARALDGIARSTDFPGVKEIFAALALLLNAAHRVRTEYKDAEKLIDRFRAYIDRLKVRMRAPMGDGARAIALSALVNLLKAFAHVTRLLKQGRGALFLKSLFVKGGALQSTLHDLETIVSDEEMMGITDIIVGMNQFSDEIFYVKKTTQNILDELQESKARDQTQHDAVMERLKAIEANDRANNEVIMKKLQDIQDQLERRASLPDPDLTTARGLYI